MSESTKIIENGYVFTGDKQNRAGRLTLLIQNGRIVDIGKSVEILKSLYPSAEVINASGKVILPGFVDAHHTGESFILRYLTAGQSMSRWNKSPAIKRAFDYFRKEATYEEFLALYRLSYYTALKSGVTTLAEYGIDNPEHSFGAAYEAMRQANVRGFIGLHNGEQIEAARKLHEPLVRFAVVVADEEDLTTYNLQSTIRFAHEMHWPIILHLGQTKRACDVVKKKFNKSITQLYADYGLFDSPVHLIHLAYFEESDFDIIAKSGVPLVLSPSAILQKGTDMPPFEELFKRKIILAFGTDWGAAHPLENIQTYCTILRTFGLPVEQAYGLLALHTVNGARVLGIENEIGTIEIGKKADIVFLNLSEFRMSAFHDDPNSERALDIVLNEATSQKISEVMINGEFYVREGHLLTYSEDDLSGEAQMLFKKLMSVSGQASPVVSSTAPILSFPSQGKIDDGFSNNDLPVEEGFRIVQKKIVSSTLQEDKNVLRDKRRKLPKNVRKIFGDDEV